MAKDREIILRFTGNARQRPFSLNGCGEQLQILAWDPETGEEVIVFTGAEFFPEEYEKNGGQAQEDSFFKSRAKGPSKCNCDRCK